MKISVRELMDRSGVAFGTSGARGLATAMTDQVCYAYTQGFLQYLVSVGELKPTGDAVAVAGDFRPSTDRVMEAVCRAAEDMGHRALLCGKIPSPAVALLRRCGGPSCISAEAICTSLGMSISTGPGRPVVAILKASWMMRGRSRTSLTR